LVCAVKIVCVAYFLGLDGGGTKTRCVIGDETSILGLGSSTSCKVQRVGEACAQDALAAAIHEACVQAGVSPRQITRTCAGITGSGRPETADVMRDLLSSIVSGEIEIVGDVEIAFEDAFGSGPGVIVIAGTGSIAYGRNAAGETVRAGGWGHAVSDEGSGYSIGLGAVKTALRLYDAMGETPLLTRLMSVIGAERFDDFIVRVNADPQPDYAAFFPVVQEEADRGEENAIAVLRTAGLTLANVTGTVVRRLFARLDDASVANRGVRLEDVSIAIHGGVITNSSQLRYGLEFMLRRDFPQVSFLSLVVDPARGALNRARNGTLSL
jgi:glucosamine kinase